MNAVHKKLLTLVGKQGRWDEVVIFENSNVLEDAIANFRAWLIENKIRHNVIYYADELPLTFLKQVVQEASVIAFQTTGTYEIVRTMKDYITLLSNEGYSKTVIECYTYESNFGYIPKEAKSSNLKMYILDSFSENSDEWKIEKLKK